METVSVLRDVLLEDLRVRMEAHRQSWEMACRARDEGNVREMRRVIRKWKRGGVLEYPVFSAVGVPPAPPGQRGYQAAISFIELGDETIELTTQQIERYVDDVWEWTAGWKRTCNILGVV